MSQVQPSASGEVRLLREVAAGPATTVFLGDLADRGRRRPVAVKLLRELPEGGVERLLDLRDRARAVGDLEHRHLVTASEVARVDARFAFIVPWVDGIDLLDWLDVLAETQTVMPRRVTCEVVRGTAVALDAAWSAPGLEGKPVAMPHRDLKPSNLMITRDGELKVTDFATGYTAVAGRAARTGVLKKGLIRYIAPERRDGHRATRSADVYALGILSLELFRGRWLRRPHSQNPAHDRQMSDVVAHLTDLQMQSDADDRVLRNILLRMVAFDADARPDMDEVVLTFRGLADRADGPSLESFAHRHAVPWLEDRVSEPDERLRGVVATLVERGGDVPEPGRVSFATVGLPDRYTIQLEGGGSTGEYEVDDGAPEPPPTRAPAGFLEDDGEPVLPSDVGAVPSPPAVPIPKEDRSPSPTPAPSPDDTLDPQSLGDLTLERTQVASPPPVSSGIPWALVAAVAAVAFLLGATVAVAMAAAVGLIVSGV